MIGYDEENGYNKRDVLCLDTKHKKHNALDIVISRMVHLEAIAKFISILLLEQVERVIQQLEIMLSYIAIVPLQKDNYRGQRNYWSQ